MKKLMNTLKNLVALSLFVALGIVGLGINVSTPFSGVKSITIDMQEAQAQYLPGYEMQTENCPGPGPETYKRCWYADNWCEIGDQTTCPDPE